MSQSAFVTPNGNKCPLCGSQLAAKKAKGGEMPDSLYIRCANPHPAGRTYFHRFDAPTPSPALLHTSSSVPALPASTIALPASCATLGCGRGKVDPGCSCGRCRRHCNELGPCALRPHERQRLLKAPSATPHSSSTSISASSASSMPGLFQSTFSSYQGIRSDVLAPIRALESYRQREDERLAAETAHLDQLFGVKSPTPESETVRERYEREEREDADIELAVQLSLAEGERSFAQAGSSRRLPSPLPIAGPSLRLPPIQRAGLRDLSLSPEFPMQLLPPPAPGRARAPDATGSGSVTPSVPRKRVPAASVHKGKGGPLRLTTQLNPAWMSSAGGPDIVGTSRAASSPSTSTFHIRQTVSRRPLVDTRLLQRFILAYIDKEYSLSLVTISPSWAGFLRC
ncbi:hypothetical protein B0H13DRAFT_1931601 [Mycena leptocephala]|nr:hypothetical protein B0H13DRAFT_1931601 [Mycena leptocephala]